MLLLAALLLGPLPLQFAKYQAGYPELVQFSPDSKQLLAVERYGAKAQWFDVASYKKIAEIPVPGDGVGACYSFANQVLLTAHQASAGAPLILRSIKLHDPASPRSHTFLGSDSVFFAPGNLILIAYKRRVDVVAPDAMKPIRTLPYAASGFAASKSGKVVALSNDKEILLLSWPKAKLIRRIKSTSDRMVLGIDEKAGLVFVGPGAGSLGALDMKSGKLVKSYKNVLADWANIAFSPNHRYMAVGEGYGAVVKVVEVSSGRSLYRDSDAKIGPEYGAQSIDWSANGRFIAAGFGNGVVKVWDVSGLHG